MGSSSDDGDPPATTSPLQSSRDVLDIQGDTPKSVIDEFQILYQTSRQSRATTIAKKKSDKEVKEVRLRSLMASVTTSKAAAVIMQSNIANLPAPPRKRVSFRQDEAEFIPAESKYDDDAEAQLLTVRPATAATRRKSTQPSIQQFIIVEEDDAISEITDNHTIGSSRSSISIGSGGTVKDDHDHWHHGKILRTPVTESNVVLPTDFPKAQPMFRIKRSAGNAEMKRTPVIVEEPGHLTSVALTGDTSEISMGSEYHMYLKDALDGPTASRTRINSESLSSHSSKIQSSLSTHEDTLESETVVGYAQMSTGSDTDSSHFHSWKRVGVGSSNTSNAAQTFTSNSNDAIASSLPSSGTIETYSDGIPTSPLTNCNTSDAAQTFANSDSIETTPSLLYTGGARMRMLPSDASSVGMTGASEASAGNPFNVISSISNTSSNATTSYEYSNTTSMSFQASDAATTLVSSDDAVATSLPSTDTIATEEETYIDQVTTPRQAAATTTDTNHQFQDQNVAIGILVKSSRASILAAIPDQQASPPPSPPFHEPRGIVDDVYGETWVVTKRMKRKKSSKKKPSRKAVATATGVEAVEATTNSGNSEYSETLKEVELQASSPGVYDVNTLTRKAPLAAPEVDYNQVLARSKYGSAPAKKKAISSRKADSDTTIMTWERQLQLLKKTEDARKIQSDPALRYQSSSKLIHFNEFGDLVSGSFQSEQHRQVSPVPAVKSDGPLSSSGHARDTYTENGGLPLQSSYAASSRRDRVVSADAGRMPTERQQQPTRINYGDPETGRSQYGQVFVVDPNQEEFMTYASDDRSLAGSAIATTRKSRKVFWFIMVLLVLAGLAIVIGALVALGRGNKDDDAIMTTSPSAAPNVPPTSETPTAPLTRREITKLLSDLSVDNGSALGYDGTPQNEALSWIVDSNDLSVLSSRGRIIQRYALATLYFSTGGDNWDMAGKWLTNEHECSWHTDVGNPCNSRGQLIRLELSANGIQGKLPEEIGLLLSLKSIDLSSNGLYRRLPDSLWRLEGLRSLVLHDNELSGELPANLGSLSNLNTLSLYLNQLSGSIPSTIGQSTNLNHLLLSSNKFDGTVPTEIRNLNLLTQLEIESNSFTGNLPVEVFFLLNLERLFLNDNSFAGNSTISSQIGSMVQLISVSVERCGLTGNLPSEVGLLKNLEALDMHGNEFSGTIPTEVGAATSLKWLDLSRNGLSGPLPSEIGSLRYLEILDTSDNSLSGQLPRELASIKSFQAAFDFRGNALNGSIPEEFCVQSCCAQGTIEVDIEAVQPCDRTRLTCSGEAISVIAEETLGTPVDPTGNP